jgi:hypothetical protein
MLNEVQQNSEEIEEFLFELVKKPGGQ